MSRRVRTIIFVFFGAGAGFLLFWGVAGLPPFGHYHGPYGLILNQIAVAQRHVTDIVAAVNFDYRGLDTIGEELILFVAVGGVVLLLRTERDEVDVEPPEAESVDRAAQTSEAVRALCLGLVAPGVVLAIYIITHGHLTPGGGFQGGAILASALVLIFLAGEYTTLRGVFPAERSDIGDAVGAGGFVVIGFAGMVVGEAFLQNVIPLGPVGELYSSGTIPLINISIGLEVGAGFLLILTEFLRQTLQVRASGRAPTEAGVRGTSSEARAEEGRARQRERDEQQNGGTA